MGVGLVPGDLIGYGIHRVEPEAQVGGMGHGHASKVGHGVSHQVLIDRRGGGRRMDRHGIARKGDQRAQVIEVVAGIGVGEHPGGLVVIAAQEFPHGGLLLSGREIALGVPGAAVQDGVGGVVAAHLGPDAADQVGVLGGDGIEAAAAVKVLLEIGRTGGQLIVCPGPLAQVHQVVVAHGLQVAEHLAVGSGSHAVHIGPDVIGQLVGVLGRKLRATAAGGTAADIGHLLEQALGRRRGGQSRHFGAAARLAQNGHVVRIAAKGRDVVPYPLQRQHQVGDAHVGVAADGAQVHVAHIVQPGIGGNKNAVGVVGEVFAVVDLQFQGGAGLQAAPMDEHQHRLLGGAVQSVGPDVQVQALAFGAEQIRLRGRHKGGCGKGIVVLGLGVALGRYRAIGQGVGGLVGRAVLLHRRGILETLVGAVGNAFERVDAVFTIAHDRTPGQPHDRRQDRRAVAQRGHSGAKGIQAVFLRDGSGGRGAGGEGGCACQNSGCTGQGGGAQKTAAGDLFHIQHSFVFTGKKSVDGGYF